MSLREPSTCQDKENLAFMMLRELPQRRKMSILAGVLLAMLLGALDATIVGPAMPHIVQDLGGMKLLAWVFTIYSLASTIAIPIVGKLSDLYGRKWFYIAGIGIFLAGSALSGAAGEQWLGSLFGGGMLQLIVFRGIQGLGGGMMQANAMAIIGDLFEPRERGRYQGLTGAVFGLATVIGPQLGGWLTDTWSWRWIFYINVPVGILALIALFVTMPQTEYGAEHRVDWWGATALAAGLVPLLLALNWAGSQYEWGSATIVGLLAAAAILLVVFGLIELRASEPILDLRLFRDRGFSASMAVLFLTGVGMFGSIMYLPIFMQIVQGKTATNSGALLTPMLLSLVVGSILTGQLVSRTGRYKIFGIVGIAVSTLGMYLLSGLTVDTTNARVIVDMLLVGFGIGVTLPLFTISLQAQHQNRIGEVTGAMQFFRSIGGTLGVALLGGIVNAQFADQLRSLVTRDTAKFGPIAPVLQKLTADPEKLLNAGVLQAVAAKLPVQARQLLVPFVADIKVALANGISQAYFWGFVLMAAAFLVMFLVREVPLTAKAHLETPEEVGTELFAEEAVQPTDHEPSVLEGHEAVDGQ